MGWGARAPERVADAEPIAVKAPLFRSLIEGFDPERRYVVLDLGAARTQTIALLGRFRCRLDIAGLDDALTRLADESDPDDLAARVEALLPPPRSEATDVVLCWDLLNYLPPPAMTALMSRIAARARSGALVHALIVYSETHMPDAPRCIVPRDGGRVLEMPTQPAERRAPRYSPDDLCRSMSAWRIERAMLLRNGMQEFLFRT